jgi:carboxyl-terminal processing protease
MRVSRLRNVGLICSGLVAGVLLSIGIAAVAQRSTSPLPLDELRQFSNVFAAIKNNYVEDVPDTKLINGAIAGMLADLDPHSAYLDAEAFKEMQTATQGEFGGLGIEIGTEDGFVKVISPIEDTPATRAGMQAGDLIIKINDSSTKGMSLTDAVKLMRGPVKTPITITVMRQGSPQPIVVNLVRDVIKVRSVRSKMLPNDIAYVRIAQFQERTGADLVKHLRELSATKSPRGLILDLRNDPGGLLTGAIGVSAAFLKPDVLVVSTDGRVPEARHKYLANPVDYARGESDYLAQLPAWAKTVPMVVLVNSGSASASEIVAGALQDHKRATIMGNQTFGKGSVQVILPISQDTAIKITTSRYYTPSGRSIQALGVTPDLMVTDTAKGDLFTVVREADLQKHLTNGQDKSANSKPEEITVIEEVPAKGDDAPKPFRFGEADDFQLDQAVNFLLGKTVNRGPVKPRKTASATPADMAVKPAQSTQPSTKEKPAKP